MKNSPRTYMPHLVVKEIKVAAGAEWTPQLSGWTVIQVSSGHGYWLQSKMNHELNANTVLLVADHVQGIFRASLLGVLTLQFFPVELDRMMGFFTFNEQRFFELAASKDEFMVKVLPAQSPTAARMKALCAANSGGPSFRLQLLQLFVEAFGHELTLEVAKPDADLNARERLREFLKKTPTAELLNISIAELARLAHCSPRHLSRIFQDVVGVSFREKYTDLRMARARELLATTDAKVVDVAFESGYQSLSLFNLMFTRRFGMSPGRWRETQRNKKASTIRARKRVTGDRQMATSRTKNGLAVVGELTGSR